MRVQNTLGCSVKEASDNLAFTPRPIEAVGLRAGDGPSLAIAMPATLRLAALRAYAEFPRGRDWVDKFRSALTVAISTRSADTCLMQAIQNSIILEPPITCAGCRQSTLGLNVIRSQLFPRLAELREHANDLLHHLDNPENRGIATLNIQGVFEYCYHLFQECSELLFGNFPQAQLEFRKCRACRIKEEMSKA